MKNDIAPIANKTQPFTAETGPGLERHSALSDEELMLTIEALRVRAESMSAVMEDILHSGSISNSKYQGKIRSDTMQGKVETEWSGNTFTKDWEAERVKD
jgi:hypothetical protein